MKKILITAALMLGSTGVAQAAPTITSPTTLNLMTFGTGNGGGLQADATVAAALRGFVFSPGTAGVFSGTNPGNTTGYSSPLTGNANYLAVQPNGSISFTFATAQTSYAALIGTIDTYNLLTFTGVNGSQQVSGADILAALAGTTNGSSTRNVQITGLNAFTTVTATDSLASAFEFVPTVVPSVPEPAAWGMMILGFGLVGGVLRRRSSANVTVRFA